MLYESYFDYVKVLELRKDPDCSNGSEEIGCGGSGAELGPFIVNLCGIFALTATLISLLAMFTHLKHYTQPHLQRIPVYAVSSWISLVSLNTAFYSDAIRDIYEAFVIYCFFNLMVNYMGGERSLLNKLYGRAPTKHMWPAYYFSKEMEVGDPYSFLFLKRGILQYVYVKPVIAIVTMILKHYDLYEEGNWSWTSGYSYIAFVYNISVCLSLYCLVFLYQTIKNDIIEYQPLAKFLCVKAIVFFSFWQGLVISALVSSGVVRLGEKFSEEHTAVALQDSLICIELLFGAIAHWYAFTYKDYQTASVEVRLKLYYALRDATGLKDLLVDSMETYNGSQFNYRTFEPADVNQVTELGRRNRIKAGLRYSSGGQHKYWLTDYDSDRLASSRLLGHEEGDVNYDGSMEELSFDFVIDDMEIEQMYLNSRSFKYGDYNIPTIETFKPIYRELPKDKLPSFLPQPKPNQVRTHGLLNRGIATEPQSLTTTPNLSIRKNQPPPRPNSVHVDTLNSNKDGIKMENEIVDKNRFEFEFDHNNASPWLNTNGSLDWKREQMRLLNRAEIFNQDLPKHQLDPWA